MKAISFCVWGNKPQYLEGMAGNLLLAPYIYPGWDVFIYWGSDVPEETRNRILTYSSAPVQERFSPLADWRLMLDRFRPITEDNVDVMISRDADSRLTIREKLAVDEWLASNFDVHAMHDHPFHTVPMLGGMWGMKKPAVANFGSLLNAWHGEAHPAWQCDQEFLTRAIWPFVKEHTLDHASFHAGRWFTHSKPFASPRSGFEFVGATINENGHMVAEQVNALLKALK
jgi:hypothetical protein